MSRTHHARRPRGGYWIQHWILTPQGKFEDRGWKFYRARMYPNFKPSAEWRAAFVRAREGVARDEILEQLNEHRQSIRDRLTQHVPTCPRITLSIPVRHLACYRPFKITTKEE